MTRTVVVAPAADGELREIARWYRKQSGSEKVAADWYVGFGEAIDSLGEDADRHPLAPESDDFPFELRALLYGSGRRKTHRALFRILDDVVEVLAVRHLAQQELRPDDL